jgi:hypothetical protein
MRVYLVSFILLVSYAKSAAQVDSLLYKEGLIGCSSQFFEEGEQLPSPDKTILVTKTGKAMSFTKFMSLENLTGISQHALEDLDNDGKKELVVYNFSNGAHCCESHYVFRNIGPNKYQLAARTFGGTICIRSNVILYDFYEPFGYFFACYACSYEDSTDTSPLPVQHIELVYRKGKLVVVPGDTELKSTINDNLGNLSEQPYQEPDKEMRQDNGIRKEFALNLVVYYYSFGKNLVETKRLFDKYYKFPDAKKVWAEFTRILSVVKKNNDF